jgi:hypothetical protein
LATALAPTVPDAAGPVLHDEVLSHGLVEFLHQDTLTPSTGSAGRERHHHGDLREGIGLR